MEHCLGIVVDRSGNAYVTGWTESTNFPTENPYQTDQGIRDVFVAKIDLYAYLLGDANMYNGAWPPAAIE